MKLAISTALVSEALISVGLYLIYPPAALIILGVQGLALALLSGGSK